MTLGSGAERAAVMVVSELQQEALMPSIRKTSASYAIDITVDQFLRLETWEDENGIWPSVIHNAINAIDGVRMVEMNGHFGASIFIDVDAENDTPQTHEAIMAAVATMIKQARKTRRSKPWPSDLDSPYAGYGRPLRCART